MINLFIKRISLPGSESLQTISFNVEEIEKELQQKNKKLQLNYDSISYTVDGNDLVVYGEMYEDEERPVFDIMVTEGRKIY